MSFWIRIVSASGNQANPGYFGDGKFLNGWDISVKSDLIQSDLDPPQLHVSRFTLADSELPPLNRLTVFS